MNSNFILIAYSIYLPVAVFLTIFVSRKLYKNSQVYMLDIFKGRESIAKATNTLFEVGFYLLNLGFALLLLKSDVEIFNSREVMEVLSVKLGGFSIYLGVALFFNLYLFFRGKRKSSSPGNVQTVLNHPTQF